MKIKVFSVYDSKTKAFLQPFFSPEFNSAIRAFSDVVNAADGPNPISRHPDDYQLCNIGEFDDQEGRLIPSSHPTFLGVGTEYKKPALPQLQDVINAQVAKNNSDASGSVNHLG